MVLDTSVCGQTYIEDCEVCCRPIEVRYTLEDDEVSDFEANSGLKCPPREVGTVDFHAKALKVCSLGPVVVGL